MSDTRAEIEEAIWQAIKEWDLERKRGDGYAGATGTDVDVIIQAISPLLEKKIREARIEWLDEQIEHILVDIYPSDVFTKPTDEDYTRANNFDANLHTRLHCDGIRHGLHILRREVRGLSARDDLEQLKDSKGTE